MNDKSHRQRVLLEPDPPKRERVLIDEQSLPFPDVIVNNGVTAKEERFIRHWITHYGDPAKSVRAAGYASVNCRTIGYQLLRNHRVQTRMAEIERELLSQVRIDPKELFREIVIQNLRLARARPPVQVWNPPCRHCYGVNGEHQRTHAEFEKAFDDHMSKIKPAPPGMKQRVPLFDPKGGSGYNDTLPPNPDCENCHGEGDTEHPVVRIKDSRLFTPEERELFAGAKKTKDGVEVIWKDQAAAREFLNDLALRMTEYTKPVDEPTLLDVTEMSESQLRKMLVYAKEQGFDVDLDALDAEVDE